MSGLLEKFQRYKHSRIAVYGLGTETEKVLQEIGQEFQIVGLLDGYREEGMLYDKRIISLREALECGVELILVVARPGSCKAIAKRIGRACTENHVSLIDVRGKDLCASPKATYDFKGAMGISKLHLRKQIGECDVVSVDLFDTLIMRQVLFPSDVPELVEHKLREKGIVLENFCQRRMDSEKRLSKSMAPTLLQIYSHMEGICFIQEMTPKELACLEWEIDYGLVIPRREMYELIEEAFRQGKEVYIVSDTYYTKEQIAKLLEKCGITSYTDIFASCEYGEGKMQGLFGKLKVRLRGRRCIHIGDDAVADVESAERNGLVSYQIYSGLELLEMTGYMGLWDSVEGLADRIKVGMFVSRLFNSPFQFETEGREICIRSAYDAGYLFFAPVICDFVMWFASQVEHFRLQNVWFGARDGYLIKKLYDDLKQGSLSVYFLVSRTAAIQAGMEDKDDIRYVSSMKFSGSLQEQLRERFGITMPDMGANGACSGTLMDYSQEILDRAAVCRKNYQAYIRKLGVKEGDIAFFDFVAKGTSQMYIGRLVKNHLKGLYFLQLEEELMRGRKLDIVPFYEPGERDGSEIYESYYILETILTSSMPSVIGFDGHGQPYYAEETRKEKDIACVHHIQEGIIDYFRTYIRLCPEQENNANKKLDGLLLSLIHNISIQDRDFYGLKVEDPFFNRVTDVADLI